MSLSMGQAWDLQFEATLHTTYQQTDSLLERYLDPKYVHRGVNAAIDHFERLGNVVANDNIVRHGQTKILNPNHSKRATFPVSSDAAVLLANVDEVRSMVNPQNAYMTTIVAALKRRADKHIIGGALNAANVATVGADGSITYGTQALLGSRIVNGTGASQALALADIINAGVLLSKGGVPPGSKNRLALYSPGQLKDVMNITNASSSDFTANRIHDTGSIDGIDWEGFHWQEIQDAVDETATSITTMLPLAATIRSIVFMARDSVALTVNQGVANKVSERPDLNDEIQVRAFMTMGSTRMWEGGVVRYDVLEN